MSVLDWFNPTRWIILAALVAALGLGVPLLIHRHNTAQQKIGYDQRADEDEKAATAQTERIRELSRLAETKTAAVATVRDRYITRTQTEIRYAAQPLAACPVPEPLRVRLNKAARCAGDDTGAACEPDGAVPVAR